MCSLWSYWYYRHLNNLHTHSCIFNQLFLTCLFCRLIIYSLTHTGVMYDEKFLQHLIERNHYLCLRFKDPVELFCSYCGDFQYCKEFDNLIGKKRGFHLLKCNRYLLTHLLTKLTESLTYLLTYLLSTISDSIPVSSPTSGSELNSSHNTSTSDELVETTVSSPTLDIVNQNTTGTYNYLFTH